MTAINQPISLARALKFKKRIESRLHRLEKDIIGHNSIMKDAEREVDVKERYKEHQGVTEMLIRLRVAIWKASLPIQPKILAINELKSRVAMLGRMNTNHGLIQQNHWRQPDAPPVEYQAEFRKADVDRMVSESERKIDELQDEIDRHNANTNIHVEELDV